jgi:hypothetical protein
MILHPAQRDALRNMGRSRRIQISASLWEHARLLKEATLRALHPDWSDDTIRRVARKALQRERR